MPMQTFFNLPEEKKRTILKAAKQEFSRVPFEEASIANIIKLAEIPRGSFYQYFYNKEDLFIFMMSRLGKRLTDKLFELLKENDGDLIEAFIQLFYFLIELIDRDKNAGLFKNAFFNMSDKIKTLLTPNFEHNHPDFINQFNQLVNFSKLTISEYKEVIYVVKMIKSILFQNLASSFNGKVTKEEIIETYLFQMHVIKKSIYRNEQHHT